MRKYTAALVLLFASVCMGLETDVEMGEAMPEFEEEGFSQAAIIPSDSDEIAQLEGKNRVFSDFCIRSRDLVIGDIKRSTSGLTANLFTLFFKSAEDVGLEALSDVREFANKMTAELTVSPSRAEGIIKSEQNKIVASNDKPKSIFEAVARTIGQFGSSVSAKVVQKLEAVRAIFGLGEVVNALVRSCGKIAEYNQNLQKLFDETKDEISEMDASLGSVKIEAVNCVTSKRLMRINGLCKIVRIAQSPIVRTLMNIRDATYYYEQEAI